MANAGFTLFSNGGADSHWQRAVDDFSENFLTKLSQQPLWRLC